MCRDAGAIPQGYLNCEQRFTTQAFPFNKVTANMIKITSSERSPNWSLISNYTHPIEVMGREDLTAIIKRKMRLFQTEHALKLYRFRPFAKKLLGRN
ncbi:MAG: hypothetical protein ABIK08_05585 [Pseudomonadota bacterium]